MFRQIRFAVAGMVFLTLWGWPPVAAQERCDYVPNWGAGTDRQTEMCTAGGSSGEPANWGMARTEAVTFAPAGQVGTFAFTDPGINLADLRVAEGVGQALGELAPVQQVDLDASGTLGDRISDSLDPRWANVNQWNDEILAAQAQVFTEIDVLVPANVVKSVMMIESQGIVPDGANYAGARGLMQVTPMSMGGTHYDYDRIESDPAYSIYCGIYELALRYEHSGRLPWRNVIVGYFSGHYEPTGTADAYNTDAQYQAAFDANLAELTAAIPAVVDGAGPVAGTLPGEWLSKVGTSIEGLAYLWANMPVAGVAAGLTQEFGPTDWSRGAGSWMYEYAYAYGFLEPGHTGLDINIPAGTPLYAPTDGMIACAGTNNGPAQGSREVSCSAFESDYGGSTSGRLEMELPNGDLLIFGHANETIPPLGATVKRGDLIGISGGQFGDHLHLEYRKPDTSTDSDWRIVDPRLTTLNLLAGVLAPSLASAPVQFGAVAFLTSPLEWGARDALAGPAVMPTLAMTRQSRGRRAPRTHVQAH